METPATQMRADPSCHGPGPRDPAAGDRRVLREARPARDDQEPGDVRGRGRGALTTVLFVRDCLTGGGELGFSFQIILWLWFTVLFANFAEAVAEGRGKAQAATPARDAHRDIVAKRLRRRRAPSALRAGAGARPEAGRHRAGRGRRPHPERRRGDRRHRLGRTSRRSPANPRRSSARPAATARRSPAARGCCPTGSRCASPRRRAPPSSIA